VTTTAAAVPPPTATPSAPGPLVQPGVWCETFSGSRDDPDTWRRGACVMVRSPVEAIRWMKGTVRMVLPALQPCQHQFVRDRWLYGPGSLEDYTRLCRGWPCSLTVHRRPYQITWRARPGLFLRIVAVNGGPPCTAQCAPAHSAIARQETRRAR